MSSSFHSQSFNKRMETGGDPAENAFRAYAIKNDFQAEHYGFDRSELKGFGKLPPFVKVTPDFACVGVVQGAKQGFLVECKGVGRFDHVKIKESDVEGLGAWATMVEDRVFVFIFDSHLNKVSFTPYRTLATMVSENTYETGTFHDNPSPFYKIPKTDFEWEDHEQTD